MKTIEAMNIEMPKNNKRADEIMLKNLKIFIFIKRFVLCIKKGIIVIHIVIAEISPKIVYIGLKLFVVT